MPKPKRNIHAVASETQTPPPTLEPNHAIARVKQAAGNNLYHLTLPGGEACLAELPARFRNTIWIKRGSYVVVDTAALANRDNKLTGEIVNIVREEKVWRKMPYWPQEFGARGSAAAYGDESEDEGPQMPPSDSEDERD